MENFFDRTGVMAIGTRLKMLSERVIKDAEKMCALYNVDIKHKWYPVMYILMHDNSGKTVTEIANEIGHSHVSVIKLVKEMSGSGLIIDSKDENDGRKTNIFLSAKGKQIANNLKYQHQDTTIAIEKMLSQMEHNLWLSIEEFEDLLDEKSTYPRVLQEKRIREAKNVQIVPFEEKYTKDFELLNKSWIEQYFKVEEKDQKTLEHPQEYIINKGGHILVALYKNEVVGVCALAKMNDDKYDYELSKMIVSKRVRGKGIGLILGQSAIEKAKELKSRKIFLETNTLLSPAISLYKKLGFKQISGYKSDYERSNYQMELVLNKNIK